MTKHKNKQCKTCKIVKPLKFFEFRTDSKTYRGSCKDCRKIYRSSYVKRTKKQRHDYYIKNRIHIRKNHIKWEKDNKKYLQNYNKRYRILNYKKLKQYRLKNKIKLSLYNKKYRNTHKKYYRDYNKNWLRIKRKTDTKFNIVTNLRNRLSLSLKGCTKSLSTMFLIGCEVDYLMYHLQKQFKPGMSWDNYGRKKGIKCWEIDHIKSCCQFDLSKPKEQIKCFNYKNLQPLWAIENKKKKKK